jgi:general secretion pathway protein K
MAAGAGSGSKGIALIVTLTIITLLVTVSLELNRQVRGAVTDSANFRDRARLKHMLRSGVSLAEEILVRDKQDTEVDSIQEDWANPEIIESYLEELPFAEGELSVRITDELSRIQVNALVAFPEGKNFSGPQQKLWFRFVNLMLAQQEEGEETVFREPVDPAAVIEPVKDWLDSGDNDAITGLNGAEDEYYRDLSPAYACRNGPMRDIRELLRTKGITEDLFQSTEAAMSGIARYMTVHGIAEAGGGFSYPGRININTAEIPVLAGVLPAGHEFLAPEIAAYREEKEGGQYLNDLTASDWYRQVPGMSDVEMDPELITTKSDIFRIHCLAERFGMKMGAEVVVERRKEGEGAKWKCRVLSWRYQ